MPLIRPFRGVWSGRLLLWVSENNPSETVRKGVRVTSEASILVVSSNKIELLGLFSSVFEASGRSYQDFSDSLSRQFVNKAPLLQCAEVQRPQSPRGTMFS